jgi:hypothetical protein
MRQLNQIARRIVVFVFIAVVDVMFGTYLAAQEFSGKGPMGVRFTVAHNDISGLFLQSSPILL